MRKFKSGNRPEGAKMLSKPKKKQPSAKIGHLKKAGKKPSQKRDFADVVDRAVLNHLRITRKVKDEAFEKRLAALEKGIAAKLSFSKYLSDNQDLGTLITDINVKVAALEKRVAKLEITEQILNSWDRRIGALEMPDEKPEPEKPIIDLTSPSPLDTKCMGADLADALAKLSRSPLLLRHTGASFDGNPSGQFYLSGANNSIIAYWNFTDTQSLPDFIRAEFAKHREGK
jgi:hypothetical protein